MRKVVIGIGILGALGIGWALLGNPFNVPALGPELSVPTLGVVAPDTDVPPAEIEAVFNEVRVKINDRIDRYRSRRRWSGRLDWLAFLAGTVVTVFAAALGLPSEGTNPKPGKAALVLATIAAIGTGFTGASARLGDQGETARSEAVQMRDAFLEAQAAISQAGSPDEVRRLLEELRTIEI